MKICLISYEYAPFPGGGIATYHNAAARLLADAGHEVHVVTNRAWHGHTSPELTQRLWQDGNLTIHRLFHFDENREAPPDAQFLDVVPGRYGDRSKMWAAEPSNLAAAQVAAYVEQLHLDVGLDVIESPEFFAEAFYILRARMSGQRSSFPPVCVHGHISSRIAFAANLHSWELGYYPHRQMMLREEYCVQHADALLTPSLALMRKYEELFGDRLPEIRRTIPYFLDLGDDAGDVPPALAGAGPFLVCVGRFEPRKGSDLALRAFAKVAPGHEDLKLAFLGKELWHQGETVEDVVEALVPPALHNRILRLGNVPRGQALAAMRAAAAFLHPVPWDNYPCAVLEAMAAGAVCIVSDQGGQSEMVEHEKSGLVVPANDVDALASAIDHALAEPAKADGLRRAARTRVSDITDTGKLLARKVELYEAMLAREQKLRGDAPELFHLPPLLKPQETVPPLPGKGVVVLDIGGASDESIASSRRSIVDELASSPGWRVAVLRDPRQEADLPGTWNSTTTIEDPVWLAMDDDDVVVWVLAGTRFDLGCLRNMVRQPIDAPVPCGSFVWLRPASAQVFPMSPDFGWQDLLIGGKTLPPAFALRAGHLRKCRTLSSLFHPHQRICALLAAASADAGMLVQHTGEMCGDFYGELPLVTDDVQLRAVGYLEILGLMPRHQTMLGNLVEVPTAPVAPTQSLVASPSAQDNGAVPVPSDYAELKRVYAEHMALKQMGIVRMMRKLGLFGLVRRVLPKSEKFLGSGRKD